MSVGWSKCFIINVNIITINLTISNNAIKFINKMKNKNKKTKLYNPYSVRTTFHKSNQSKKKTSKNVSRPNKKLPEF